MVNEQDSPNTDAPQANRKKSSVKKFFSKLSSNNSSTNNSTSGSNSSSQPSSPSNSHDSLVGHHQPLVLVNFVKEAIPDDEDEIERRFIEAVVCNNVMCLDSNQIFIDYYYRKLLVFKMKPPNNFSLANTKLRK